MSTDKLGPSRKISLEMPDHVVKQDLEALKQEILGLGAAMAEIIPADWVEIDERVRLKCSVPLCPHYNRNLYCPPHAPPLDLMRNAISRYSWSLLFAVDVIPPEQFADRAIEREAAGNWARKSLEITGRIEVAAFGRGYHLAMGLAQGSCIRALCGQERCLVLDGRKCPYPLQSRPSMESTGIDVYRLVTKVGWDIYPIYRSVDPQKVPRAMSAGIVFVC
jgi:predicted metal-binding protein